MTAGQDESRAFGRRSAPILLLLACGLGCAPERAAPCGRLASALLTAQPKERLTSRAEDLLRAARAFTDAAGRLAALGTLPAELDAIAKAAQRELTNASAAVEAAATARKAARQPEYAAARKRAEDARRALLDLSTRFGKLCGR